MIPYLKFKTLNQNIDYDGSQLTPHWIYQNTDILGNSLIAFTGKADVKTSHMVDLTDVKKNAPIYSEKMLHFLGEFFIESLDEGILFQQIFIQILYETLLEASTQKLSRKGNDIFFQDRKLSVSISTKSAVSILMHTGLNIINKNTPIPTSCLVEMGIDPLEFTQIAFKKLERDVDLFYKARVKVIPR